MARWQPVPIVGGAYADESKPWSSQDAVNWIPEVAERPQGRSDSMLRGAPGLVTFVDGLAPAPVRGLHDVEGLLLGVVGTTLYRFDVDGQPSLIGTVPGTSLVSIAHNQIDSGHEVIVANGQAGYLYNTRTGSFGQISDPGFPGIRTADFCDGYLTGTDPAGRFWFHSDLRQGAEYNTLDRYDAEAAPDKIVGHIVSHREVLVLGERSGQFFRNTGATTGTFQNANGTEMEVGLASPYAIARMDNTVYWLGSDGIIYRLEGNQPRRVSLGPIEQALANCDIRRAFAFTFEDRGHKVFYLTLPDGHTWGYDVWTNEWHRRESKGLSRWRINALVKSGGQWIAGDYANGKLYRLDWDVQDEDGATLDRRRVTGVLHDNQNALNFNGIDLVFDTGRAPRPRSFGPVRISGHLPGAFVGDSGVYQYRTQGGQPARYVTVIAGALPPGATIDSFGKVAYHYTTAGEYSWTLRVQDVRGQNATLVDSATIAEKGFDPTTEESRYLLVAHSDTTDRSAVDFDDSTWETALLPLGTNSRSDAAAAGFPENIATLWPLDKNAWFRATFELGAPLDMHLSVYLDDAAKVWINGVLVFDHTTNDSGGTVYLWETDVLADKFVAGTNHIAIFCRGDIFGINNYVCYLLEPL